MDKSFLGTGWSFPPTIKKETGIIMVSDATDIAQSLQILMNTSLGERIMVPEYGSNLVKFVFEPISTTRNYLMQEVIITAITKYEARITLNSVQVNQADYLDGIIKVLLDYTIRATNSRFNLVFPYYKIEGTGIPHLYAYQKLIQMSQAK